MLTGSEHSDEFWLRFYLDRAGLPDSFKLANPDGVASAPAAACYASMADV